MSASDNLNQAIEFGQKAVVLDQSGKYESAAFFYEQAAGMLEKLKDSNLEIPVSTVNKAVEYKNRAADLRNLCKCGGLSIKNTMLCIFFI